MKSYIDKTPKFTKDQLVFIVDVMITAAMSSIDVAILGDYPKEKLSAVEDGILEKLCWDLSILCYQTTGEAIGCCDVLTSFNLDKFISKCFKSQKFRDNKDASTKMAKKFVNELFEDYLKD